MLRYLGCGLRRFGTDPMYVHRRANWEFFVAIEGACGPRLARGGAPPLRERCLWVFPPDTAHGWRGEGTRRTRVAIFHYSVVPDLLRQAVQARGWMETPLSAAQTRRVEGWVAELQPHYERMTAKSSLLFDRVLLDLTLLALEPLPHPPAEATSDFAPRKVEACLTWYAESMAQRPKLSQVAQAVHLSPRHLRRLFQDVRGESPQAAFTRLRVERALELLARADHKLETIADECGFASVSDLCRVFRHHRGISPHAWRRRLLRGCPAPATATGARKPSPSKDL